MGRQGAGSTGTEENERCVVIQHLIRGVPRRHGRKNVHEMA